MRVKYILQNWRRIPRVVIRKLFIENTFRIRRILSQKICISSEFSKWHELKDRHKGETVVVVGNGPSLKFIDFELLSNFTTFGSNKIFLNGSWRPTYYSVEDDLVMIQNIREIINLDGTQKLFPCSMLSICKRVPNSLYFEFSTSKFERKSPDFISPKQPYISWGSTIVYTQIQLAVWMGAKKIILVGVDFNFTLPEKTKNSSKELVSEGEVNHFHPSYRAVGEKWNVPQLHLQEIAYKRASAVCEEVGIEIVNASPGSKLTVFSMVSPVDVGLSKV